MFNPNSNSNLSIVIKYIQILTTLISGTYPEYLEDLGFDYGEAIIAKASFGDNFYRTGFDVSVPLFAKNHPYLTNEDGHVTSNSFPPRRKYLISFKGKRLVSV